MVAGALFVLPGALLMFVISWVYVVFGNVPMVVAWGRPLVCCSTWPDYEIVKCPGLDVGIH